MLKSKNENKEIRVIEYNDIPNRHREIEIKKARARELSQFRRDKKQEQLKTPKNLPSWAASWQERWINEYATVRNELSKEIAKQEQIQILQRTVEDHKK